MQIAIVERSKENGMYLNANKHYWSFDYNYTVYSQSNLPAEKRIDTFTVVKLKIIFLGESLDI